MDLLTINTRENMRKKKFAVLYTHWTEIMNVCVWLFDLIHKTLKEKSITMSLQAQIFVLDVFKNRQIVYRLVYESDSISLDNLRMTRYAFSRLCTMLEVVGGLKSSKYLCVDEQVAMFLHILAHHMKNRVIKFQFMRSEQTITMYFHNVLHSIICLHGELLKRPDPIPTNSTYERWKWFKECVLKICNLFIYYLVRKVQLLIVESFVMLYDEDMVIITLWMRDIQTAMVFLLLIKDNVIILVSVQMEDNQIIIKSFLI
ncbi:hypothetical protein UlMin_025917 [Ulmus minor]